MLELVHWPWQTPAAQLAFEEALLEVCEASDHPGFLSFWEAPVHFVVLGYGKRAADEVQLEACAQLGVPVLRRTSGGGTVLQGPGCFNYSLILPIESDPELATITGANRRIMESQRKIFSTLLGQPVTQRGCTDLTLGDLKFSGNAQRRKRRCLLFHGSILIGLDFDLVERTLRVPGQQPEYRRQRSHTAFLTNVPLAREAIRSALAAAWLAQVGEVPAETLARIDGLVAERYGLASWNLRF